MSDKYIFFWFFFILGTVSLFGAYKYKPLKEDIDNFNITKFRLYSGAFLALSGALLFLIFG